jgi:hypothetical protein
MGDSGGFNIEIDQDSGEITLIKPSGEAYTYIVEELEGKGILDNLIGGGAQVTVYSQGESFTLEEYKELFGSE